MNRIYRLVWNRALGVLQVASELTRAAGGPSSGGTLRRHLPRRALATAIPLALGLTLMGFALPAWATCTPSATQTCGSNGTDGSNGANGGNGYGGRNAPLGTGGPGGAGGNGMIVGQSGAGGAAVTATATLSNGSGDSIQGGNGGVGGQGGAGGNGGVGGYSGGGTTGGAGGRGGSGAVAGYGGNGGNGVVVSASALSLTNDGSITGGTGGVGGYGGYGGNGGSGGNGGPGGIGGMGGVGGMGGTGGNGGSAVIGSAFDLTNSGSLSGGAGGAGYVGAMGGRGGAGGAGGVYSSGSGGTGGSAGAGGDGGGGGMGGAAVAGTGFTLGNSGSIVGGAGGNGAAGFSQAAGGGLGGAGGAGAAASSNGGNGGQGGNAGHGGDGGAGGDGVSGQSFTLTNTGSISGGNGGLAGYASGNGFGGPGGRVVSVGTGLAGAAGAPGQAGLPGAGGLGGAGVVATGGSMVINAGTIQGGFAAGGSGAQANAINFSGGGNTLELQAGSTIIGNVISTSGTSGGGDTLALGGDSNAAGGNSFNLGSIDATLPGSYTGTQYVGFANFVKEGASTWTVTGSSGVQQGWNLLGGTLQVGSSGLTASITGSYGSHAAGGTGVSAAAGTTLIVGAGSSVTGGAGGYGGYAGGAGVYAGPGSTQTNTGSITGGAGGGGYYGGIGGAGVYGGNGGAGVDAGAGSTVTNTGTGVITGGQGGYGDYSNGNPGGIGGAGVTGDTFTLANTGMINGGIGGAGGNAGYVIGNYAGSGGAGGAGVTGNAFTLTTAGSITGGAGGTGGYSGHEGNGGTGGDGVSGSAFTATNTGTIMGGVGGGVDPRGYLGGYGGRGGAGAAGFDFMLTNGGSIVGGAGGIGGFGFASGGNGGTGGAGVTAYGALLTNTGRITGGAGGTGGGYTSIVPGGAGGAGGAGVTGYGFTLTNTGSITGGAGGVDGTVGAGGGPVPAGLGSGSPGGVGVVSTSGSTVINAGAISGGLGADGVTRADAIDFSNGGNTLELEAGSVITGNVVSASGTTNGGDTLAWGGDINAGSGNSFALGQLDAVGGAGQYQGFANLGKTGASTWTLTGTDSQSQVWTVAAGTLILDGSVGASGGATISGGTFEVGDASSPSALFTGNVAVQAAGTLRGHGTIGGNVSNAGTVMPGGSLGILTVNGNYSQSAGATLALGVSPQTVAGSGYSQLQVGGTASLAGTLQIDPLAGDYTIGDTYDLLHAAGGVSGTFASTFDNPAFATYLSPAVTYSTNDVTLKLNATATAFSSSMPNYASTNALALDSTFQTVLGGAGSAPGTGMGLGRKGAWVQYTGSNGALGGIQQRTRIAALGFGVAPEQGLVVGGALSADNTTTTQGNTRVDGRPKAAFVYAIAKAGKTRAAISLGAGRLRADSTRLLPTLGLAANARSTGSFIGFAARVDTHYGLSHGWFVAPYFSTSYLHSHYGSTTESGAGLLDITYGGFGQTLWRNSAGVRLGKAIVLSASTLTPWVQVGGEGFTGNRSPLSTEFIGAQSLPVSGTTPLPGGAWTAAAGLDWQGQGPWRLKLAWLGVHGHHYHSNGGTALLQYVW